MFFLHLFWSGLPVKIGMGKGIGSIYKYDEQNWSYPYPNNIFFIPPCFDTSIQTQCKSASYAFAGENDEESSWLYASIQTQRNSALYESVGANDVSSYGLYQSTNHHCNMYGKNNDDSQSYETPHKTTCCSHYFFDTISTTTTPRLSTLIHLERNINVSKWKGKVPMQHNVLNQEHWSIFL